MELGLQRMEGCCTEETKHMKVYLCTLCIDICTKSHQHGDSTLVAEGAVYRSPALKQHQVASKTHELMMQSEALLAAVWLTRMTDVQAGIHKQSDKRRQADTSSARLVFTTAYMPHSWQQ